MCHKINIMGQQATGCPVIASSSLPQETAEPESLARLNFRCQACATAGPWVGGGVLLKINRKRCIFVASSNLMGTQPWGETLETLTNKTRNLW